MDAPAVQILLKNASNGLQIFAGCIYEEDYKKNYLINAPKQIMHIKSG